MHTRTQRPERVQECAAQRISFMVRKSLAVQQYLLEKNVKDVFLDVRKG